MEIKKLTQDKQKTSNKKYWRLFLLIVFLFFIGNIFFQIPRIFTAIQKPFASFKAPFANQKRIDFNQRTNLLLINYAQGAVLKDAWVASFDPAGKQIYFFKLPTEVSLSSDEKNLAEAFSQSFDQTFWVSANFIGSPVDGYLAFKDVSSFSKETILESRKNLFSFGYIFNIFANKAWLENNLITNLSSAELFRVGRIFKGTNADSLNFSDVSEKKLSGVADLEQIDRENSASLIDSALAQESSSVSIVNGTGTAGLGSRFKRIVGNLGGRVLSVKTRNETKTKVLFQGNKEKLAKRIAAFLGVGLEKAKENTEADVEVILGSDLASELNLVSLNK